MIYHDWQRAQLKCHSEKYKHKYSFCSCAHTQSTTVPAQGLGHTDQEKPGVMLTAYRLRYLHTPTPCHLALQGRRMSSSARQTDKLHHAGRRARAGTQVVIPRGPPAAPCAPPGTCAPLPTAHPNSSTRERWHFAPFISASCQQCQLTEVSNRIM